MATCTLVRIARIIVSRHMRNYKIVRLCTYILVNKYTNEEYHCMIVRKRASRSKLMHAMLSIASTRVQIHANIICKYFGPKKQSALTEATLHYI